ncbi:MAG TPA: RNA polymerase factor sigma-54 [Terriglobia bacterium]|jgi:RNA polymerase sigma-54 factor|nr:RNA polymerase factor sigma-54 [Terriglobia bacterium]
MPFLEQRLNVKLTQKQTLTPGLVQMVSVLALNKLELSEMISQELMENPVLEEVAETAPALEEARLKEERAGEPADKEIIALNTSADGKPADPFDQIDYGSFFDDYLDPGYRTQMPSEVIERPSFESFLAKATTLYDHLHWQLNLSVVDRRIADAAVSIIGNLNEDGYLTATLEEIAATGDHTLEEATEALKLVQTFDPSGVAARDLGECLSVQLVHLGQEGSVAAMMVQKHLKQLQNKQYQEIARALARPLNIILAQLEIIKKLDPRPGQRYNKSETRVIEPDIQIVKTEEGYSVVMNEDDVPQLRLNGMYKKMIEKDGSSKDVREYVKERYSSAMQFIKNIEQRKQTIMRVCESIVRRQIEFLDKGIDYLRPMMIKDVAEEVGVHPSTVSRAVANKYAHTPQGVYELRYFFSEAVQGPAGIEIPLLTAKRKVKKLIEDEDPGKPLTDEQITKLLNNEGIMVTRRTVAKYREDLKIPSTHQRRVKIKNSDHLNSPPTDY